MLDFLPKMLGVEQYRTCTCSIPNTISNTAELVILGRVLRLFGECSVRKADPPCGRPGKSIKGVLFEYSPGGFSPGHMHAISAFIYATVLEGAICSQVNDGPVKTYKAGQSLSELPGDRHAVSVNASKTKSAKLLAMFVVDTNETLTIPFGN